MAILAIVYSGPAAGHHHDQESRDLEASSAAAAYPAVNWYPSHAGFDFANWPTNIRSFPAAVVKDSGVIRIVSGVTAADLPALEALPADLPPEE